MKCSEILSGALNLLNEKSDVYDQKDLEIRVPYIMAALCSELENIDGLYRKAKGLSKALPFDKGKIPLAEDFPLCDRFISCGYFYVASMIIMEENSLSGDEFYDKFCESLENIKKEIPCSLEQTVDVYSLR